MADRARTLKQLVEAFATDAWEDFGAKVNGISFDSHTWRELAAHYGARGARHLIEPVDGCQVTLSDSRVLYYDGTRPEPEPEPGQLTYVREHPLQPKLGFCPECYTRGKSGCVYHRRLS